MISRPTFHYEQRYWQQGVELIAGIDEVGVGALAGPVVAAAVVFASGIKNRLRNVRDSKTLSVSQREALAPEIKRQALAWGIGEASVEEISTLNIRGAAMVAMKRAVEEMRFKPDLLLIDGYSLKIGLNIPVEGIVKGDSICRSIAAASILAKVYRDDIMRSLAKQYPTYGFDQHKGYGTRQHLTALKQRGATPHHRIAYAPVAELLRSELTPLETGHQRHPKLKPSGSRSLTGLTK